VSPVLASFRSPDCHPHPQASVRACWESSISKGKLLKRPKCRQRRFLFFFFDPEKALKFDGLLTLSYFILKV
jgi:hypothetical protein